jgi:peroxiredoxin
VVGINTGEEGLPKEKAQAFQQQYGLTYPILLDEQSRVSEAYRVQGLPTNVIIDRDGKIRYISAGFDPEAVARKLEELLGPAGDGHTSP